MIERPDMDTGERLVREQLDEALVELKRRADQLERSNRDLAQFAYVASHDLQTPLRKVRSFAKLLEEEIEQMYDWMGHEKKRNVREYLRFIVSGAEQSQALVDGLLSFSRVGRRLNISEVHSRDCFSDAFFILQDDIQEKRATVLASGPLPKVWADKTLLTRVFQNLIGNAIKFRQEGVEPKILVSASDQGHEWRFAVRDNGIGISDVHAERIFHIFQRLGTAKSGLGLGLALCKKIVESHGGKIWFTSTPGEGSTFCFTVQKGLQPDEKPAI